MYHQYMLKDFTKYAPTTIALVGDWHADAEWALPTVDFISKAGADIIISVGDFGFWPRFNHGQHFLKALDDKLAQVNIPLWWVDGNHEDHDILNLLPVGENGLRAVTRHIHHIPRGFRWEWDGFMWMGLGGAASVDREDRVEGVDWFEAERISEEDAAYASRPGAVQVMVTHEGVFGAPPLDMKLSKVSMWPAATIQESNEIRGRLTDVVDVVKPKYLFHGHHHTAYSCTKDGTVIRGLHCNGASLWENVFFIDVAGARCM